jgi:hypothetical protein
VTGGRGSRLLLRLRAAQATPQGRRVFRDGVTVGAVVTTLLGAALWLASARGPDGSEVIVERGAAGPVVSASPAEAVAPAPVTGQPSPVDTAPAIAGAEADQEPQDQEDEDVQQPEAPAVLEGPVPRAAALPLGHRVRCPAATVEVTTADELTAALADAAPGDVIELADGTYAGAFVARTSGTASAPIWLCGGRDAVLDGGGPRKGYGLHLVPAQHWRVVGFTVRNAQKGVMADGTSGTVIQDLLVEDIGDEAVHLRSGSTGNAVLANTIRRTGLRRDKFGEGVYVGSAHSNWPKYSGGEPDRSDFNLVADNEISETGAESVDIKEGTTGGAVLRNTFDGAGMTGGDSWIDVKGNEWLIAGNSGRNAPEDGMQTHRILDGWGARNVFTSNTFDGSGSGLGIYVHDPDDTDNVVRCDNRTTAGGPVTSNVACTDR